MYKEHSALEKPEDENIKIWRYMDFAKLISILDSKSLYFTRPDKFQDMFEGSIPKKNYEARKRTFWASDAIGWILKQFCKFHAVNCWHMNEHESAAMWKLYLKSNEGVAIQSTYSNLKDSFIDEKEVHIGIVKYIDYETDVFPMNNDLIRFTHKRKSFQHEQELRAITSRFPKAPKTDKNIPEIDPSQETMEHGIAVSVNINTLIQKIYIAPEAPHWYLDLIKRVVAKYGYSFDVVQSQLNETPLF
jgi:hypothetical protein